MGDERQRIAFAVRGRVQGVGFRAAAQREAARLGLVGHVRNRSDGAVEGEAEGAASAVAEFVLWLGRGPAWSRVEAVDTAPRAAQSTEREFAVRR